tara:strand:- start:5153 stop:6550 length:1398 start_codon:yes stop_codon:yes gene_type:complete
MSDLKRVLREEYNKQMSSDQLLALVEESLDAVYTEFVESTQGASLKEAAKKEMTAKEFLMVLPKFTPTEAWGNPESMERAQINRLFSVIGGGHTIEGKMAFLRRLTEPNNKITSPRRIISTLIILESLKAVLQSFNAASAGFVFEGWLAALLQGVQIGDVSSKGNLPIQDLIAFASSDSKEGMGDRAVPISLKLLNQTTDIEGSYTNLVDGLDEFEEMVYIVARKDMVKDPKTGKKSPEGIAIEQFTLDRNNFIDALSLGSRGSLKGLADLFILPGDTAEESIVKIKNTKNWEEKYNLLQTTQGYSERIRKKRAAAEAERAAAATAEIADADEEATLAADTALAEAIREEFELLTESRGGTQWKISVPQLASFPKAVHWKSLGALPVSEKKIIEVATQYMDQLNEELMTLFAATQALSENINKYFTFDKRSRAISSAETAINDALVIQKNLTAQISAPSEEEKPE